MNLFLIRHSLAENPSPLKVDSDRKLTQEGNDLILKGSRFLKFIAPDLKLILTSPYLRALQTAEIIAKTFDNDIKLIKENNLAAGCSTGSLIEILNFYDENNIAIIGHQPDISNHISNFTSSSYIRMVFSPATIAKIRFESKVGYNKGIFEALIQSEVFK